MAMSTLTGMFDDVAETFPFQRAISVYGKFDLTYAQLHQLVERAAARLVAAGVKPGNVVALTFPNTVEFVIMFLAAIRVRATAALLDPACTFNEFEFYLSTSESKLLLTSKEGNEPAQAAAAKLNIPHISTALPATELEIILSPTQSQADINSGSELTNAPSDVAVFLHIHGACLWITQQKLYYSLQKVNESGSAVSPLFPKHSLLAALLSSLGARAAALPAAGRFSASTYWSGMNNYGAPRYANSAVFPSLRFIGNCNKLSDMVAAGLKEAFRAPVLEEYTTEATRLMASNPLPEYSPLKPMLVGKPGRYYYSQKRGRVINFPNDVLAESSRSSRRSCLSLEAGDLIITPVDVLGAQLSGFDLTDLKLVDGERIYQLDSDVGSHNMATYGSLDYGLPDGVKMSAVKNSRLADPTRGVPFMTIAPDVRSGTPEVRIDILEEGAIYVKGDDSVRGLIINPVQEKGHQLPISGPVVEYVERAGGWLLSSLFTSSPGPIWARLLVECAKIVGFALSAAGYGSQDYNKKLSQFLIKTGGIATATAIIGYLAMPLQAVVALPVGLAAWLIVVASILCS